MDECAHLVAADRFLIEQGGGELVERLRVLGQQLPGVGLGPGQQGSDLTVDQPLGPLGVAARGRKAGGPADPEPGDLRAFDLLVIGDCNPDVLVMGGDLTPAFGQQEKLVDSMALVVGGSASITAIAAARLGSSPELTAALALARDVTVRPWP